MDKTLLKYSTAQPVAHLKKSNTYFFFQNNSIAAEYAFETKSVKSINGSGVTISKKGEIILVTVDNAGLNCILILLKAMVQKLKLSV